MKNFNEFLEGVRWYENGKLGDEDDNIDIYLNNQNNDTENQYEIDDEEFKNFLIINNCYDLFINAMKEQRGIDANINQILDNCDGHYEYFNLFTWLDTDQGYDFWDDIDDKWHDYLNSEKYPYYDYTDDEDYIDDGNN